MCTPSDIKYRGDMNCLYLISHSMKLRIKDETNYVYIAIGKDLKHSPCIEYILNSALLIVRYVQKRLA